MAENTTAPAKKPRRIFLATPAQSGVPPHWVASLFNLYQTPGTEPIELEFGICTVGSIAYARDSLVEMARDLKCDGIVWSDADMKWAPADFYRMISHGKPIVGASYARKQVDLAWVMTGIKGEEPDENGLLKVREVGTGFLWTDMEVFERMARELPDLLEYDKPGKDGKNKPGYNFFYQGVIDRRYHSEDYGFCALARQVGFDIYADTKCIIPHTGSITFPLPMMHSMRSLSMAKAIKQVLAEGGPNLDLGIRNILTDALTEAA